MYPANFNKGVKHTLCFGSAGLISTPSVRHRARPLDYGTKRDTIADHGLDLFTEALWLQTSSSLAKRPGKMTQNAFEMSRSVEQLWDADIPVNYRQICALILMLIHPAYS